MASTEGNNTGLQVLGKRRRHSHRKRAGSRNRQDARKFGLPRFNFSPADWSTFLRIPELGRIRLGHEKQTLAELSKLKVTLTTITTEKVAVDQAVEILQEIRGIGRNLATKLLALCTPEKFVVVNEPVEKALRAFGYDVEVALKLLVVATSGS